MATLSESASWTAGIYQLETTDPVLGGPDGIDNLQAKQLANRTVYLKQHVDALESGTTAAGKATVLATARSLAITGDASWSVSFNGSANASAALTLANSGVTAGAYAKVTVNAKGLVTAGASLAAADIPALDWSKISSGKPTTLGGYGITDAQPLDADLSALAALTGNGLYVSTGTGTATVRSIAAGTGVSVSNGDGVAGNPQISLSTSGVTAGSYAKVTVDAYGRVTAGASLAATDVPALDWTKITSGKPTTLGGYGITDAQPLDADLTALAGLTGTGLYVSNGAGSAALRSIAAGAGVSVSNGDGAAGNPTIANTGVLSVSGTANQVTVSGSTGNVVFSLPQSIHSGATPSWAQVTLGGDPTAALQAATKQYVDNLVSGLDVKTSVLAATTANITLSGTQTIDGVAVTAGARVLVKNQTTASQNGIYLCATGAWTRVADADTWNELISAFVFVEKGTTNADTGWVCTIDSGGTLGSTAVTFTQFAGAGTVTAGAGISVSGNQVALSTSGVTAGTYPKVTVDQYGRITAGAAMVAGDIPNLDWSKITSGKPTTLSGYGITDAAPKNSPALTGTPSAPTPAQFDSSTTLATSEFVQRALGNLAGQAGYTANTTLTSADVGKLVGVSGNVTITLPLASDVVAGALLHLRIGNGSVVTIVPQGSQTLSDLRASSVASIVATGATYIVLRSYPDGTGWEVLGGDSALRYSSLFGASLANSGYQRLPSGLILQWGVLSSNAAANTELSWTYPIAFPNSIFRCFATHTNGGSPSEKTQINVYGHTNTLTKYNLSASGTQSVQFLAIGY